VAPEPAPAVVLGPGPPLEPTIDGFSDKSFLDVATILLAHPSLLPSYGLHLCYAGDEFFPDRPFVRPAGARSEKEQKLSSILIEIGGNLLAGIADKPPYGIEPFRYKLFDDDRESGWKLIMWDLWPGALHVKAFLDGPPEFMPTAFHLADVKPYFEGSRRYAEFLRDSAGLDVVEGVGVMNDHIKRLAGHRPLEFPRIPKIAGRGRE